MRSVFVDHNAPTPIGDRLLLECDLERRETVRRLVPERPQLELAVEA